MHTTHEITMEIQTFASKQHYPLLLTAYVTGLSPIVKVSS